MMEKKMACSITQEKGKNALFSNWRCNKNV